MSGEKREPDKRNESTRIVLGEYSACSKMASNAEVEELDDYGVLN